MMEPNNFPNTRGSILRNQMFRLFVGLFMAVVPQLAPSARAQSDKDLPQQIFDTMLQLPGNKPGARLVHAKGMVCQGTFTPSKDAAVLSRAIHFNSASVPVTVRFSDAAPDPTVTDASPDSTPYGMAIRFLLPDNKKTDIVAFAHNGFVVGTGEDFLALQKSIVATDFSKPHPWPVEGFLSTHPRALKFVQDPKPAPNSFATEAFFGNNAFLFVNAKGAKQVGRYQILPVAGAHHLTDVESKAKVSSFLFEELKTRLPKEPIKFRLVLQLPNSGDPTNDASIVWAEDRKIVELGVITVASVVADSDAAQKALAFDPTFLPDGIELSDDRLPVLRSNVYMLSRIHRQGP